MAAREESAGKVRVEYEADLRAYTRQLERAEKETGQAVGRMASGFRGSFAKVLTGRTGEQSAKEFLKGITEQFDRAKGEAKERLLAGFTDRAAYQKAGIEAGRAFNNAIQTEIRRRGDAGTLDDATYRQLSRRLKIVGQEGGEQLTEGIEQGARPGLSRLDRFFQTAFRFLVAGAVVRGLQSIAGAIDNLLNRASRLSQLSSAIKNIAFNIGVDDVAVIKELQNATNGLVSRFDLIQKANVALQAGLPGTAEQMGRLAYVARRLAETVGLDAGEAFDRLVNGIAKGETEILDNLGLMTRQEDAYRRWELQTGRNSDALSGQEKQLIFYNAILEEAEGKVRALGEENVTAGQRLEQTKIFLTDVKDAAVLAVAESPKILQFFEDLGVGARDSADRVDQLANRIGAMVDALTEWRTAIDLIGGKWRLLTVSPQELDRAFEQVEEMNFQRRQRLSEISQAEGPDLDRIREGLQLELRRVALRNQANEARRAELERLKAEDDLAYIELGMGSELADLQRRATLDAKEEFDIRAAILAVEERRIDLARTPTGGGRPSGGTPSLSADDRNRLEEQARKIREDMTVGLAELTRSAMDEALLQLNRLEEEARSVFAKLGQELPQEIAEGFEQRRAAIIGGGQLEDFARELAMLSEAAASPETNEALRQQITALEAYIDAHGKAGGILAEGTALRERFNEQLRQTRRQLEQNEKALRDEAEEAEETARKLIEDRKRANEERLRSLRESARSLEENARAGLQMAEAIGLIDSEAAQALGSVVQLGTAIGRIAAGDLTAIPAAIGAVASIFNVIAGKGAEAEQKRLEAQKALVDQLEQNRKALEENTRAVASGKTVADITAGQAAAKGVTLPFFGLNLNPDLLNDITLFRRLREELKDREFREKLTTAGEASGVDLLGAAEEAVDTGEMEIFRSAWDTVRKILKDASEHFGAIGESNFAGQMERFRTEVELLDLDSATQQLEHFLKTLRAIGAGDFASQIEGLLAGGDIEGARQLVRAIFEEMQSGGLTAAEAAGLFGGNATPEDITRILTSVNDWLEEISAGGGVTGGGSAQTRLNVSMTEIQGGPVLTLANVEGLNQVNKGKA